MNLPNTSVNSAPPRDKLLAQSGSSESSVDGIKLRGEPSMIKTITGISHSTGQELQGELMFGKTDSGKPMFLLQGQGKNYALRGADGKPVTNAMDAEMRAVKLITGGGATQLRAVKGALGGTEVKAPNSDGVLTFNLEDRSINSKGGTGVKDGFNIFAYPPAQPGSALTSQTAIEKFRIANAPVTVFNENAGGNDKNARWGASVSLSNDARGGKQFAQATDPGRGFQPFASTYSLPAGASPEFKRAYENEKMWIGAGHVGSGIKDSAEAFITGKGAGRNQPVIAGRPTTTEQVQPQKPAGTPPVATPTPPSRTLRSAAASPAVRQNVVPTTSLQQSQRSQVNRATNQAPYTPGGPITGSIGVRPGINLAKLGDYKLRSLETIAKEKGVPADELRVMVFVRHGESMANKGDTFAGNVPGIRTPGGWARPPEGVFTSLPNGQVMRPGGQIPLSELGRQQAREAGPLISELRNMYDIKSASVSPVLRAQQTFEEATQGQPPFDKTSTTINLAERGMGNYIGKPKKENAPTDTVDIKLDGGRQTGFVGPNKTPPSVPVKPTEVGGRATPKRPVEDRTGFEDWNTFNGRIKSAFNTDVLPELVKNSTMQVSHQYSIASQLKRIDPRIDTAELGHGIPNGQPLVVVVRVQPQGTGAPKMSVVDAGYYRGTPPASSAPASSTRH